MRPSAREGVGELGRSVVSLSHYSALTLERNVSLEAVRRSKGAAMRVAADVAAAVHTAYPALDGDACLELVTATCLTSAGLWQVAHPSPVVIALYAESAEQRGPWPAAPVRFADTLARFIGVHVAGLRCV